MGLVLLLLTVVCCANYNHWQDSFKFFRSTSAATRAGSKICKASYCQLQDTDLEKTPDTETQARGNFYSEISVRDGSRGLIPLQPVVNPQEEFAVLLPLGHSPLPVVLPHSGGVRIAEGLVAGGWG